MLKYLIIFSLIYISGCTVKNNKSDRVNFEELSKELFSSFGYTTKVIFHKEELDLINIYISKSKMTKNDFKKNIESVLLKKGWVEIPSDFDDQFIYCFDKKMHWKFYIQQKNTMVMIMGIVLMLIRIVWTNGL